MTESNRYEPGRYRVEVCGASLGKAANGTPQIELGLSIVGRYDGDGNLYDATGPERTCYMTVNDNTMGTADKPGWVWQTLLDLGFCGASLADLASCVGAARNAECKIEEHQGRNIEKWSVYRRRGASAMRPVEGQEARALDSKYASLLRTAKAKPHEADGHAPRSDGPGQSSPAAPPAPRQPSPAAKPSPAHGPNGTVRDAYDADDFLQHTLKMKSEDIPF